MHHRRVHLQPSPVSQPSPRFSSVSLLTTHLARLTTSTFVSTINELVIPPRSHAAFIIAAEAAEAAALVEVPRVAAVLSSSLSNPQMLTRPRNPLYVVLYRRAETARRSLLLRVSRYQKCEYDKRVKTKRHQISQNQQFLFLSKHLSASRAAKPWRRRRAAGRRAPSSSRRCSARRRRGGI